MTESRISFLYNIASCLQQSENNESLKRLRSFYLMRCKEVTGGYGLPIKYFSKKARCPHCCLEWNKKSDVNIKPVTLSSRQKQRIRSKLSKSNEKKMKTRKAFLQSNQMEQTCSFCKHTTATVVPKPEKEYPKTFQTCNSITKNETSKNKEKNIVKVTKTDRNKSKLDNVVSTNKNTSTTINVYSNAFDVFSLKNQQNTLASTIKESPKIIKNNKKKKDKFAGLCQKAVLASAKMTQDNKQNKLSLFLKPSTG